MVADTELGGARDEALAIGLPLLANEVGMRRAEDDINGVRPAAKDRWHRVDHIFDPLVRGKKTEGEDDSLASEAEARLCLFRLGERYVRNAVRNYLDLLGGHVVDLLQKLAGLLGHNHHPRGGGDNPVNYSPLSTRGL